MKSNCAASAQRFAADQHPVFVGVEILAGIKCNAAKGHGHIFVTDAFLECFLRVRIQGADTKINAVDISRVADAAIDDRASPAIFRCENGELVANQSTT